MVRTINGMGFLFSSRSPRALALRPVYRALNRYAGRRAACTVFQNSEDRTYFRRNGMITSPTDCLIPGSGVDVDGFEEARIRGPSPAELRERLGLGSAEVVITVSRLTRQKGIPVLLAAAERVHLARPDVRFLLVGPRESEGPFAMTNKELDRHRAYVDTLGSRNDVPSLLRVARIFAFPTEYREGVPRAALEAALSGLPIVATRVPGCTDVVRDGWNGFIIPPRDPERLASRILELLDDPALARSMGERGADLVRREFTLASIVERYARLYSDVLAGTLPRTPVEVTERPPLSDIDPQSA